MKMNNELYDTGKWVVFIFLPAFAIFMSGLGDLYHWNGTADLVTMINLVAVFLGSILQVSSHHYHGGGSDDSNHSKTC